MKAIVENQGQQLMVKEGDILFVNRYIDSKAGDVLNLDKVLYVLILMVISIQADQQQKLFV